jgi:hypothetical protein
MIRNRRKGRLRGRSRYGFLLKRNRRIPKGRVFRKVVTKAFLRPPSLVIHFLIFEGFFTTMFTRSVTRVVPRASATRTVSSTPVAPKIISQSNPHNKSNDKNGAQSPNNTILRNAVMDAVTYVSLATSRGELPPHSGNGNELPFVGF